MPRIANFELIAGVRVPVDARGRYLDGAPKVGDNAPLLISPWGPLQFRAGDFLLDYAVLPDGDLVLMRNDGEPPWDTCSYEVVSGDEAVSRAAQLVDEALAVSGGVHDHEWAGQDPDFFVRAVGREVGHPAYAHATDSELRSGAAPRLAVID